MISPTKHLSEGTTHLASEDDLVYRRVYRVASLPLTASHSVYSFGEMKFRQRTILPATSLAVGAVAVFVFLTLNDPDGVAPGTTQKFAWMVLCPVAFILASVARVDSWLTGLAMISGVMIGACVRFLIPPLRSNIWPIAAVIWVFRLLLPITVGSLIGGIGSWSVSKARSPR